MRSILNELYNGHISPWEQIVSHDPEYRPAHREISQLKEQLAKKLDREDIERLEKIDQLFCATSGMHGCASFSYGVKLGAQLILEILTDGEQRQSI